MKVLLLSTNDIRGGAAKVAYDLATEYIRKGHEVKMLVANKESNANFVVKANRAKQVNKVLGIIDTVAPSLLSGGNTFSLGLFGNNEILEFARAFKPDVINIHWTNKGFLSAKQILKLDKLYPTVIAMHDSWHYLDGRHLDLPVKKQPFLYMISSELMKIVASFPRKSLSNVNSTYISPSRYLKDRATTIGSLPIDKVFVIPNPINTPKELYDDKEISKVKTDLGLNPNKKYILFSAVNFLNDKNKGFELLYKSLKHIEKELVSKNIGIMYFGSDNLEKHLVLDPSIEVRNIGYIRDRQKVFDCYIASSVYLHPSMFENLSIASIEAVSTGTPIVGYNVGGQNEVIVKDYGSLIEPFETEEFANQTLKYLEMPLHYKNRDAMKYATKQWGLSSVAEKYLELYSRIQN